MNEKKVISLDRIKYFSVISIFVLKLKVLTRLKIFIPNDNDHCSSLPTLVFFLFQKIINNKKP